jgi:hypothetical protein
VPDRRPLLEKVTPEGSVDGVQPLNAVFENVGAGVPDAVAWKESALSTEKLAELALVIVGAPVLDGACPVGPGLLGAWPVVPEK